MSSKDAMSSKEQPSRVVVSLVERCELSDLPQRIASWFPPDVEVQQNCQERLTREEVVDFAQPETVGVWVYVREDSNVIYLVSRRAGETRFFRRDLTGGHSEEALESLAQAVHYLVVALWEGSVSMDETDVRGSGSVFWGALGASTMPEPSPREPSAPEADETPPRNDEPSGTEGGQIGATPESLLSQQPEDPNSAPLREEDSEHKTPSLHPRGDGTDVHLGYGLGYQSGEPLMQGPEVGVGIGLTRHFRMDLTGRWLIPEETSLGESRLKSRGGRVRLSAEMQLPLVTRLDLVLRAGGGLNLVRWREVESLSKTPGSGTDFRPFLNFSTGPRLKKGNLRIQLLAELDTFLVRTRYSAKRRGEEQVISNSGMVAPGVSLSVAYVFHTLGGVR